MHSEIVSFNDAFLKNSIPVLDQFFKTHIIAELLTRRLENKDELPVVAPNVIVSVTQSSTAMRSRFDVTQKTAKASGFISNVLTSNGLQKDAGYCPSCKNLKGAKRKYEEK